MKYSRTLLLLGSCLILLGTSTGGWGGILGWLGVNFMVLGIAHWLKWHHVFGKRQDGTLPLWSWVIFLPLLCSTTLIWWITRILGQESAADSVTDRLVVGRRLLPSEANEQFDNYVDLTSEFAEPSRIRRRRSYRCLPILDGGSPSAQTLKQFLDQLQPGRTFIHCAQGHGRTGLVALALLLHEGTVQSTGEGLKILTAARPRIRLSYGQRKCIEAFAALLTKKIP